MLRVKYDEEYGLAIADGRIFSEVTRVLIQFDIFKSDFDIEVTYSTELMLSALRLEVLRGKISKDDIVFIIDGEEVRVNEHGTYLMERPKTFVLDYILDGLCE